eukprot:CAMPEP_0169268542 /NCGR_PEP_ID=MMETSP1016-20121227/47867_1 /TAXON_ID=342587 /ORGANISM="Karlodinium micrum, Strain CCMP2283" /LENGTH=114 /DNA_ID=CAMNT_0009353283 /DNA_START=266 /DNA_END=607 /DNA_ORIENTATION=-
MNMSQLNANHQACSTATPSFRHHSRLHDWKLLFWDYQIAVFFNYLLHLGHLVASVLSMPEAFALATAICGNAGIHLFAALHAMVLAVFPIAAPTFMCGTNGHLQQRGIRRTTFW